MLSAVRVSRAIGSRAKAFATTGVRAASTITVDSAGVLKVPDQPVSCVHHVQS